MARLTVKMPLTEHKYRTERGNMQSFRVLDARHDGDDLLVGIFDETAQFGQ